MQVSTAKFINLIQYRYFKHGIESKRIIARQLVKFVVQENKKMNKEKIKIVDEICVDTMVGINERKKKEVAIFM